MTVLYLYDNTARAFERHVCAELPYLEHGRIAMRSFLGQRGGDIAWTDMRLLRAYDALCEANGGPLYVSTGFKRVQSGLHPGQSAHYAGLALHMGQGMSGDEREELRALAAQTEAFHYVEPAYIAPAWVHAEVFAAPSCRLARGYPYLERGMSGVHVFVLQDALLLCGYSAALTGVVDAATERALQRFRFDEGLIPCACADAALWKRLMERALEKRTELDKS